MFELKQASHLRVSLLQCFCLVRCPPVSIEFERLWHFSFSRLP